MPKNKDLNSSNTFRPKVFSEGKLEEKTPRDLPELSNRTALRERFEQEVEPYLLAAQPVLELLEEVGLKYCFVRHFAMQLAAYSEDILYLFKGFEEANKIGDIDILTNFNKKKLKKFIQKLENIPGIGEIQADFVGEKKRIPHLYGYSSDAFITFSITVSNKDGKKRTYDFEIFSNYKAKDLRDKSKWIFAEIDEMGKPVDEVNNRVIKVETNFGSLLGSVPCFIGKGMAESYAYEDRLNEFLFAETQDLEFLKGKGPFRSAVNRVIADVFFGDD